MDEANFRYTVPCSSTDCGRPPRFKIAAPWSYGPLRELKNYGLACDEHRDALVALARSRRGALAVGDDEVVGPVEVFPLAAAARGDADGSRPGGPAR